MDRELFGDNHPSTARTMSNMAGCYLDQSEYSLALEKYEESLEIFRAFYVATPKHPDIARSLCCIGQVLMKLGQYPQAVVRLQESLDMRQRIHGGPHNDIAQSLLHLGEVNFLQGEYSKAQQKYEVALHMYRTVYKNGHTDVDSCEARLREVKEKMICEFSRIVGVHSRWRKMENTLVGDVGWGHGCAGVSIHALILSLKFCHKCSNRLTLSFLQDGLQQCLQQCDCPKGLG